MSEHGGTRSSPSATDALAALLTPRSIVLVGASDDARKIGGKLLSHLVRYQFPGELHLVNHTGAPVQGRPTISSLEELPDDRSLDLALIATPAINVPDVVAALGERGVRAAVIVSSGFGETGPAGRDLERAVLAARGSSGIRLLGPNCQGVANTGAGVVASFSSAFGTPAGIADGSTAVISQSGAMAAVLTQLALPHVDGVRYWAATGNEIDLTTTDLLRFVVDDPSITTVQLYVEQLRSADDLADVAERASANGTTIMVLKPGMTSAGTRAASSHTGALAQDDAVLDAFFEGCGLIRARDPREMSELARIVVQPKRPHGSRVAMVTNSGGLGVLLTDEAVRNGLEIAEFGTDTLERLVRALPPFAAVHNPIDVTAQLLSHPELICDALAVVAQDDGVDIVVLCLGILGNYYDLDQILADVVAVHRSNEKLLVVCWIAGEAGMVERFATWGVPAFDDVVGCMRAVGKLAALRHRPDPPSRRRGSEADRVALEGLIPHALLRQGRLSEHAGKELLRAWGLAVVRSTLAGDVDEAVAAGREIGYPVVAKLSAPSLVHKTDLGLVEVGITNDVALANAAERLLATRSEFPEIDGVLVEPMIRDGVEMMLGVLHDPGVGPIVAIGSGGVRAELLADVRLLVPPLSERGVRDALASLKLFPLLDGYRGAAKHDVDAFVRFAVDLSALPVVRAGCVAELDLNPVLVLPEGAGAVAVDVALTLREPHLPAVTEWKVDQCVSPALF